MHPMWQRSGFIGSARTVDSFHDDFVGDACFSGCIAFVRWPRTDLERLLPPRLELAPPVSDSCTEHPVAFVFGHQRKAAIKFAGFRLPMNVDFGEFAMTIPFVRHRGGQSLHTYVPRMLSSYFPAVWDGCIRYGYRKELAAMRWQGDTYLMTDANDALLFHAVREARGDWLPGASTEELTAPLHAAFALPIVACKPDGRLVCAYWGWDLRDASVRAAACRVSIDGPLLAGLAPEASHHSDLTIDVRAMSWQLSLPFPCAP
jgi:hypothetical protein